MPWCAVILLRTTWTAKAPGVCVRCSTGVDEGRTSCDLVSIKMKGRTAGGDGREIVCCDPGSEFRLGGGEKENKRSEGGKWEGE